jgi:hypothetical protein
MSYINTAETDQSNNDTTQSDQSNNVTTQSDQSNNVTTQSNQCNDATILELSRRETIIHIPPSVVVQEECKDNTSLVFVLDVSGSMGNECFIQIEKFKHALTITGYSVFTPIHVILFGKYVYRVNTNLGGLSGLRDYILEECERDGTYMARGNHNVVSYFLEPYLEGKYNVNILIITVSDGDVYDIKEFRTMIENTRRIVDSSRITTLGIRIGFNGVNRGSTEAITLFAMLSARDQVLVDHNVDTNGGASSNSFTNFLLNYNQNATLAVTDGSFQQFSISTDRINYNPQNGFTGLVNHEEETPIALTVDGNPLSLTNDLIPEQVLIDYIRHITQKVKVAKVSGCDIKEYLRKIGEFLKILSAVIERKYTHQEQKEEKEVNEHSVTNRMRNLLRMTRKGLGTAILALNMAMNKHRINQMNAQKQADWVRDVGTDRDAKRFSRRAEEFNVKNSSAVREGLKGLANYLRENPNFLVNYLTYINNYPQDNITSWWSCDDFHSILSEFKQLTSEDIDKCSIVELMGIIGCLGPCFESPCNTYPDPYLFRIYSLFYCQLSQTDLYQAFEVGGRDTLTAPGHENSKGVTGIVPILDPYCLPLMRFLTPIFNCHASFGMRKRPETVPHDVLGLWSSAILKILKHEQTEASARVLVGIVANVREYFSNYHPYSDVIANLDKADPGAYFTGEEGISGIGKLVVCILATGRQITTELAHAMYYFVVYHWCRRVSVNTERRTISNRILQISDAIADCDQFITPLFEDNHPPNLQINVDTKRSLEYLRGFKPPGPDEICSLDWVAQIFQAGGGIDTIVRKLTTSTPSTGSSLFGITSPVDRDLYIIGAVYEMLQCQNETSRVDKSLRKTLYTTHYPSDVASHLTTCAQNQLNAEYLRLVALKEHKECIIRHHNALFNISQAPLEDFETQVPKVVTSRDSKEHEFLMNLLMDMKVQIQDRHKKLEIMMLARSFDTPKTTLLTPVLDNDGNETGDTKTWLNGMPIKDNSLHALRKVFGESGKNEWNRICSWKNGNNQLSRWRYRESDIPNRHGYHNSNPSQWALEYGGIDWN